MKAVALKLVLRSWWRNKVFSVISIVSLAIGIACANLLTVFVIHEFNLEADNPKRDRIYYMDQESPMKSGERVSFVMGNIPAGLKEKYPEVEDFLRIKGVLMEYITIDSIQYDPFRMVSVDTSFLHFFPFEVLCGDINHVLAQPDQVALTEACAKKYFGNNNPIGKTIGLSPAYLGGPGCTDRTYRIGAVLKDRDQSFMNFEALVGNEEHFSGGITLLLTQKPIDTEKFAEQLKKDGIQTFVQDGSYHFDGFLDSYFKEYNMESISYIKRGQSVLLYVSFISAVLILLIACFNYINLNFSRLLRQVRTIHTQKLMGATSREISKQLFADTFFTVILAFVLSLLITHDLVPVFNNVVSGNLQTSFFFSSQVLPLICCFIFILSVVPACYMSRKISGLTLSGYREFFTGNKKRRIVTILSIAQYTMSIGLIIATLTVNSQLHFIRQGGERYRNLIEVGSYAGTSRIPELVYELKMQPEILNATTSGGSLLEFGLSPITIKQSDGSETYYSRAQYMGGVDYLESLQISITHGLSAEKAVERFDRPLYITQKYADILIPKGEDPVGKPLSQYDNSFNNDIIAGTNAPMIIAGITEDIYTGSMAEEVFPSIIYIEREMNASVGFAEIRLGKDRAKSLDAVRQVWQKVNPDKFFSYTDIYGEFMKRNKKAVELSHLLLMYSFISISLTCFGLFGMALYATKQRTKEIGIRKINGANTLQIMLLLNKQFFGWICISFVFAVPISWLWLNRWLDGFIYRTDMSVGYFLLAGLFTLVITLLTVSWQSYKAASGNPVQSLNVD